MVLPPARRESKNWTWWFHLINRPFDLLRKQSAAALYVASYTVHNYDEDSVLYMAGFISFTHFNKGPFKHCYTIVFILNMCRGTIVGSS